MQSGLREMVVRVGFHPSVHLGVEVEEARAEREGAEDRVEPRIGDAVEAPDLMPRGVRTAAADNLSRVVFVDLAEGVGAEFGRGGLVGQRLGEAAFEGGEVDPRAEELRRGTERGGRPPFGPAGPCVEAPSGDRGNLDSAIAHLAVEKDAHIDPKVDAAVLLRRFTLRVGGRNDSSLGA